MLLSPSLKMQISVSSRPDRFTQPGRVQLGLYGEVINTSPFKKKKTQKYLADVATAPVQK